MKQVELKKCVFEKPDNTRLKVFSGIFGPSGFHNMEGNPWSCVQ